ncbi:uncharacterized protein BDR25DRAFT_331299 [Lindgomyces ingoldianus]|uniref:Uncharacterized protein n=1 Tax=Lindgomyces ingoldianus TaxID=673940 RepID=A0ACB6RBV5_9PLEO|nr:uncharacterized protein BDR25DRAFT_331299 [Lindgomyces ingoldianus]KAF2476520.1 hypothetical protein BDR25DRAFT_331299 [Lindgomyces ingoldianus]
MRSRTGCLTCRHRKLKCDEKKPICGQCCKASRECVPSSGLVFRHQHNASMNGDDSPDENTLKGFYAYKNTFDDETVWLDIPKQVTFINTSNPYLDPLTPDYDNMSATSIDSPGSFEPRLNTSWPTSTPSSTCLDPLPLPVTSGNLPFHLSDTTSQPDTSPSLERSSILQSPPTSSTGTPISTPVSVSNHHLHSIIHQSMTPPPIEPGLNSPFDSAQGHIPRSISSSRPSCAGIDTMAEQDHEIAFLLRWFSEGPGYWMDLFDLGTYFASYVPVKACENALLKYAAVAYAAKALARVQGRKPIMGGSVTRQALMELYPETHSVDWYHKATQYYDTAVSLLLQALKNDATITPDSESDCEPRLHGLDTTRNDHIPVCKRRRTSSSTTSKSNTDELLAATAILCVYEFLDASVPEWAKHLNGAKSLLVIAQERMMPLQMPSPGSTFSSTNLGYISKARRATFWNIARQDMLAAFINKNHTRLDTEDLSLWKEAGLLIDENGFILPSNTTESGYPEGDGMMKEDLICNALVWLMAKLVNFMAAGDDLPVELGGSWAGVPQRTLLDYWYHLKQQFQTWYEGLPVTFRASARIEPNRIPGRLLQDGNEPLFPEIWYSIPMCASTMQCYHMGQIQLLMNKPHESTQGRTTVFARMNSYHSVLAASQVHSREIVGISLARSDEAVRIHSVQPLYTAAQCLHDPKERNVVLNLLRDIETDIGWATDYRVRQLVQQWQWEEHEEPHVP